MSTRTKLYDQAKAQPANVRFEDARLLAKYAGFKEKRQKGSHLWIQHPGIKSVTGGLSLQEGDNGKAKPYQVRQLLQLIDEYDLLADTEEDA